LDKRPANENHSCHQDVQASGEELEPSVDIPLFPVHEAGKGVFEIDENYDILDSICDISLADILHEDHIRHESLDNYENEHEHYKGRTKDQDVHHVEEVLT